ncbi:similar to An06g00500 [Aspergillus luchuensis IFO 4308]|nr:similar to An06g00500 [Aspergillus luchuensis IFO 4308]
MVEQRLKRYVDEMIERRLKSGILDEVIDSAASECRDQIYDECKTNQAEFREQVDDGNSEVRNTTMECLKEINEQAQRHMHEIEEQAQQCMKDIEDQGIEVEMSAKRSMAELKRWFSTPAQSLPEIKSNPSREIDTAARRSSI